MPVFSEAFRKSRESQPPAPFFVAGSRSSSDGSLSRSSTLKLRTPVKPYSFQKRRSVALRSSADPYRRWYFTSSSITIHPMSLRPECFLISSMNSVSHSRGRLRSS